MKSMRWFEALAAVVVSCLAFAGNALTLPWRRDVAGPVDQGGRHEARQDRDRGWRCGAFDPSGKPIELDAKVACHTCHEAKKDREFVFSEWTP